MKTLSVRFEETPEHEVVVRLSPVPTRDLLDIVEMAQGLTLDRGSMQALAERFAPLIVSWTYPEPTDTDGLLARDFNEFYALVNAWVTEVRDAPLPLLVRSSGGEASPEPLASPSPPS